MALAVPHVHIKPVRRQLFLEHTFLAGLQSKKQTPHAASKNSSLCEKLLSDRTQVSMFFFNLFPFTMVKTQDAQLTTEKPAEEPKKLKPCCACPETKKPRDQCIIEKGEANCQDLIEAHKECMRKLGFNI